MSEFVSLRLKESAEPTVLGLHARGHFFELARNRDECILAAR
jgi:hypothetical protein